MISEHLKYKLDSIGSYLGGYSEMTNIYTEEELAFISLYPSDIFTITTWNTEEVVDLRSVGYIPFTNYFIYDKYQKLIIRDKRDGILGQTEQEEELFIDSDNGAYYFILFKDLKRWKQVLLILATQVPTSTEKEYFKKLRINSPNYTYTNERINQVILGTSNITIGAPAKILVYSLDASLNTNVSIEFIKTHAPEPVVYYSYNNEFQDIILTPRNSTWYHFVLVDNNDVMISKLETKSMGGTGESNWVFFNADLYYLELANRIPINISKLVTTNVYNRQSGINLYGELFISQPVLSANLTINCTGSIDNEQLNNDQLISGICTIT